MNDKLHFILDLDNTLLHSLTPEEYKKIPYSFKKKYKYIPMDNEFMVILRPHLRKFLQFLFDNYYVSIWTYASYEYAMWIVKNIIIPEMKSKHKLEYILFEYHCKKSESLYNKQQKRIKMLKKVDKKIDLNNTILIDDLPQNCKGQLSINVVPFDLLSEEKQQDDYLLNLMEEIKKLL